MSDPIHELAERLARVERELHALATAPRANKTSVQDGFTRWLPPTGDTPRVYIGNSGSDVALWVNDDTGNEAVYIGSSSGRGVIFVDETGSLNCFNPDASSYALLTVEGKMLRPLISCAWQNDGAHLIDAVGRPLITSGTYERVWATILPITTGQIVGNIYVDLGTGVTSAAVRIQATLVIGGTPAGAQTVVEQTGITADGFLSGAPWTIPDGIASPASSPVGKLVLLELEGRVTGGAGNLAIQPTQPAYNYG